MSVSAPISRCCRARPRSMLTFLSFPPLPAAFPGKQLDQSLIKFFSAQPVCTAGTAEAFTSLCSAGFAGEGMPRMRAAESACGTGRVAHAVQR